MNDDESLIEVFERHRDRRFLFVEQGGNWGDYLIYRGADHLARRLRLDFVSLSYREFMARAPEADVAVYLHGNGDFNSWYRGEDLDALSQALRFYTGPIIQGPCTTEDSPEYLDLFASRVRAHTNKHFYLFARELTTWRNLQGVLRNSNAHIRLNHDTALYLTKTDVLGSATYPSRYELLALREDVEKPTDQLSFNHFRGVRLDPPHYATSLDHWMRIHAYSRSIITNRTHSAILGSVLGIPVTLLPGSYHKNRSIWEFSLRERGVNWQDWPSNPPRAMPGPVGWALDRARHSYKLRKLRLLLLPLRGVPRR